MNAASVTRRCWRSFLGGGQLHSPRSAERGRDGYTLRQRLWASFIGVDLPSARLARKASTGIPRSSTREEPSREGQRVSRPEPGWFALPSLLAVGGLTAAGGDAVMLEASSPDRRARFLVRSRGIVRPEYSLELVLHGVDAALPLVSAVRYTSTDGSEQVLLVPVAPAPFGPPAAYVRLPGFAVGTAWTASGPAPVRQSAAWDPAVVADSVRASLNEATRDAWRQVRELVGDELRRVIDGELP